MSLWRAAGVFAGTISGSGAVVKSGGGTLVLTGATRHDEVGGSPWRPTFVLDDLSGLV